MNEHPEIAEYEWIDKLFPCMVKQDMVFESE